ncbi:signal transduction histidine kinase [Algoriphagus sp. 4150]|uniref:7TM diverse intracellular signaling domain-containing protein n=1 Tax=Algoriphagus sp. 4150 TaxID=2817756 RepID=UPI00285AD14A|nr:7TM diverse intracellular signaling domain-containing protein [Algoriphagus sp. 4150]MDR7129301.1 signal transduction histidine kinase [Algoriphagus sp. 4150]
MKKSNIASFLIAIVIFFIIILPLSKYLGIFGNNEVHQVDHYFVFEDKIKGDYNWNQEYDKLEFKEYGIVDLGVQNDTVYIGLDLSSNLMGTAGLYFLEINNPSFRSVELYRVNSEGVLVFCAQEGTEFVNSNDFGNPNPTFEIQNSENWLPYVILRISASEPIRFTGLLTSESNFHSSLNKRTVFINIYIGIMLALFFYNLFLYFSVLDVLYLYYSMYVLFIALAQLSLSGHSYWYFLYQNPLLYEISIIGFTSIASVFAIPFVRNFLSTKERLPFFDWILKLLWTSYLTAFVLRLLGAVSLSYRITDINGFLVVIIFFSIAILLVRKKIRSASYFLIAWSFFLLGIVFYILQTQGYFNLGFYANLPMLIGTALEAILLSLALADKINILKKENEKEHAERLKALAENEQLVREQNAMLEAKVRIRTDELEQALRNLQNTQSQLVNQEKMASLGQLTAGIAHEINNPINFVSSNVMPLKRDIKDIMEVVAFYRSTGEKEFTPKSLKEAKQLEEDLELEYVLTEVDQLLKGMDDGAKRTVEIVKGLRLFSRVDEQDMKKVDLHDGLNSTLILLNSTMPTKVRIIRDFAELPLVECLAGKINQVFMNIINNAVHALADHIDTVVDPIIELRTRALKDMVTIEIMDNGPGMPEHVKQRIFEPFFTTKAVGKGTGLGLSIVYSIIESHKGTLEVITEEGQGTTFKITLPIYQSMQRYE